MTSRARAAIPPAPRKTLLDWIDTDDGNTPGTTRLICSADVAAIHARVVGAFADEARRSAEPLAPPPGLRLAPLG